MSPDDDAYHVDWIFASGSNVHVAKSKDWFVESTYTPFQSRVNPGSSCDVLGVGDVELELDDGTLFLHDVLYAPGMACNIVGNPVIEDYSFDLVGGKILRKANDQPPDEEGILGEEIGKMGVGNVHRVMVKGQDAEKSLLKGDAHPRVHAIWSLSERNRWEAVKKRRSTRRPSKVEGPVYTLQLHDEPEEYVNSEGG